jgi:nucleoside-diphosphate-sugar epimerase
MSNALVIGGTGTTGRHIIPGLQHRGYEVAMLHRGVHEPDQFPEVEHLHGDPHFAEAVGTTLGARQFDLVVATYGRLRMLGEYFQGRCGHFIGTTGCVVWENSMEPQGLRPSGMKVLASESSPRADARAEAPYFAARVLAAERFVLDAASAGAYRGTIIRYPRLYGAYDVVPREWSIIKRIRDGRSFIFTTDSGLALHTRCAAENAAHGVLLAVDQPEAANGEDFNIGDTDQFTLRQWMEVVIDAVGGELEIISLPLDIGWATYVEQNPGLEGRMPHTFVDTAKIRNILGYTDVICAQDAIGNYVKWLVANPPDLVDYQGLQDQFDYESEDKLLTVWRDAVRRINTEVPRVAPQRHHPLPHPKSDRGRDRDERGR